MLEAHLRQKIDNQIGEYDETGDPSYLISALEILGQSRHPLNLNLDERVDWVNQIISQYRQISRDLAENKEFFRMGNLDKIFGEENTFNEKMSEYRSLLEQGKYEEACETLADVCNLDTQSGVSPLAKKTISGFRIIKEAYDSLVKKLIEELEEAKDTDPFRKLLRRIGEF